MAVSSVILRSLISKLNRLQHDPLSKTPSLACCNLRIRGQGYATGPKNRWSQNNEEEIEFGNVDAEIEDVIKEEKRKSKAVKYQKLQRQMRPKGAPERKLSWEAIEQIRFLKRESPDEWTLQRLAEGFSVSQEEVSRVLKSKFIPKPERMIQQDKKVFSKQQRAFPEVGTQAQPSLPQVPTPVPLPIGTAVSLVASKSQVLKQLETKKRTDVSSRSTAITLSSPQVSSSLAPWQAPAEKITRQKDPQIFIGEKTVELQMEEKEEDEKYSREDEAWDGTVISDGEIQTLIQTMKDKPTPVVQKGREYYDTEGNFLYRV